MSDMLTGDHLELDALLAELFLAFRDGDVELIYQRLDIFWARLVMHIRAEHLHLFPAINRIADSEKIEVKIDQSIEMVNEKISKL